MAQFTTSHATSLLWPGIVKTFGDEYKRYPTMYNKLFTVIKSDKAFEKIQEFVGTGLASQKSEGSPIKYVNPEEGFQKEITNYTYAIGSSVTFEMMQDEQYGKVNKIAGFLGKSMAMTQEATHAEVFNLGFSTELAADGVTVFNTAHPLINGATLSNRPATDVDFSQTALEQAIITIRGWTDGQGLPIMAQPKYIVTSQEESFNVEVVLNTKYKTNSQNNDINPVAGSLTPYWWTWLVDDDAWFITTDQEGFYSLNRHAPEARRENEFDTLSMKYITFARWGRGVADWRSAYGSRGA